MLDDGCPIHVRRRRGSTLIYATVAMSLMLGFASLGVDWARVQLVKTELQRAADAAARHAATGMTTSAAQAQQNAILAAADNESDGSTVTVTAADVTTGNWNSATNSFVAGGTPANAVQVVVQRTAARGNPVALQWAPLVPGLPKSVDVRAVAIATVSSSGGGSRFGNYVSDGINVSGNADLDSYNSTAVSYAASRGQNFGVAGNFNFGNFNGQAKVEGSVYHTGAAPNIPVTGSKVKIDASEIPDAMKVASTTPAGAINKGNFNGGDAVLTSGNYAYSSFSGNKGTVTINANAGPVRLYINGALSLSGSFSFNYVQGQRPADLEIHMVSSAGVDLNGNVDIHGIIHAPNSPLNMNGNSNIYGSINVKQASLSGNSGVHWDENLNNSSGSETAGDIALVQ